MIMKKNMFLSLLAIMMAATLSFGLQSCDDDDEKNGGGLESELTGYWVSERHLNNPAINGSSGTVTSYGYQFLPNNKVYVFQLHHTGLSARYSYAEANTSWERLTERNGVSFYINPDKKLKTYQRVGNEVYIDITSDPTIMSITSSDHMEAISLDGWAEGTYVNVGTEPIGGSGGGNSGNSTDIDTEVYVISDNEILMDGKYWTEKSVYLYTLQMGFGANSSDAYQKGLTQMRATVWAENGCINEYSSSNIGKKETFTLYLSSTNREFYKIFWALSKSSQIVLNYDLEYYNSKDSKWHAVQSRRLTFNASDNGGGTGGGDTPGGGGDNPGGGTGGQAEGSGTLSNPYNVAAISGIAGRLRFGEIDATDYYFKGKVSRIVSNFSSSSGTADFYISDDGTTAYQFHCNSVYYLLNQRYSWGTTISKGDDVVICGKVTNNGGTPETSYNRAYMYSLNGTSNYSNTSSEMTYYIGGRKFKTVLVEGGFMSPFYIMQTEIPISSDITVGNKVVSKIDANGDGVIIKSEFSSFLKKLRSSTDIPFRLPTKEEWQYAASGGNKSRNYTYSGSNTIGDVAWYKDNSDNKLHDVATKQANELGLYDMSGNYAELCVDDSKYGDEYSVDGIQCGGSWQDAASACKVTSYQNGSTTGKIAGTGVAEVNAVNGKYVSVRLVYTKQ